MASGPREWKPGMKHLKIRALDNHGYEYPVTLEMDKDHKWVLGIEGTPGHWWMSTLLEEGRILGTISVDAGQKWDIINFGDVMREAIERI